MTFWRNVLPNILLQGQNAVLVVKKSPQNFYQCVCKGPYFNYVSTFLSIFDQLSTLVSIYTTVPYNSYSTLVAFFFSIKELLHIHILTLKKNKSRDKVDMMLQSFYKNHTTFVSNTCTCSSFQVIRVENCYCN